MCDGLGREWFGLEFSHPKNVIFGEEQSKTSCSIFSLFSKGFTPSG